MKRRSQQKQRTMPAPGTGYHAKVERHFRGCPFAPAPKTKVVNGRVVLVNKGVPA